LLKVGEKKEIADLGTFPVPFCVYLYYSSAADMRTRLLSLLVLRIRELHYKFKQSSERQYCKA